MINFVKPVITINGDGSEDKTFKFYDEGFELNGSISEPTWQDVTITGKMSLTLLNAKADSLEYLKAFGKCEQKRLPEGYTELVSISGIAARAWFDSGVAGNNDNLKFVFSGYKDSAKAYSPFLGNYVGEESNVTRIIGGSGSTGIIAAINRKSAGSVITNSINYLVLHTYELYKENGNSILKVDGTQAESIANSSGTANSTNIAINSSRTNPSAPTSDVITTFQGDFQIYDGTTLIRNYVMAKRNSDNAVGMYDTVNDTFKTSEGTENFIAGADVVPTPSNPISIWCNNGELKVSKNLFDSASYDDYYYILARTGQLSHDDESNGGATYCSTDYIPVKPNTTYYKNGDFGAGTQSYYDANKTYISHESKQNTTFTTPVDCKYVKCNLLRTNAPWSTAQIEQGSTASSYMPYGQIYIDGTQETIEIDTTGDIATCENLLSVSTYEDVQEVILGGVTRNVGVKVLDGTEEWSYDATYTRFTIEVLANNFISLGVRITPFICSHFISISDGRSVSSVPNNAIYTGSKNTQPKALYIKTTDYTTLADFKQFLATQYANGTPVIIVYPLETPTTETVTGQAMTIKKGTNIIEVTQSSINDLKLEAQYKAGVGVTIAEIQNVNLDNSVTVTIS